mgnify:CR=1 FL=1
MSVECEQFPKIKPSDQWSARLKEADTKREGLVRIKKAKQALAKAVQNEEIKELKAAIDEAKAAGVKGVSSGNLRPLCV